MKRAWVLGLGLLLSGCSLTWQPLSSPSDAVLQEHTRVLSVLVADYNQRHPEEKKD